MSDYELRQNLHRRDEALRDSYTGSRGSGLYWIVGSGIVLLLILSLFLFGDATPAIEDDGASPIVLPSTVPSDTAPAVPVD